MSELITEILCRMDVARNTPVIFFPNSIDKGQVLAWVNGVEEVTTLAYYHTTGPLSAADEKILAARYAQASGDQHVHIRHRLPRVPRARHSVLGGEAPALEGVKVTGGSAGLPAPAPTKGKAKMLDRHGNRVKAGAAPAATNVTQLAAVAPVGGAVAAATPGQVAQAVAALGVEFNQRLEAILKTLAPAQ